MASIPHILPVLRNRRIYSRHLKLHTSRIPLRENSFTYLGSYRFDISRSKLGHAPLSYASNSEVSLLKEASNIFEEINSSSGADEGTLITTQVEERMNTVEVPSPVWPSLLGKPLWILGPVLLLITGVIPTLWLPVSSFFLGPNIASLLCLIGLDCIFNLGASLFLLMADSTARSNGNSGLSKSKPPSGYQFWNMTANIVGFIAPLAILLASEKGLLQPQLPLIAFGVMLAPYLLLLSVQIITESLTWRWESPVWLVTPVVYEAYRLVQLMRGLKLGLELAVPSWSMDALRGLVCGWVLVLGVQLMRVAWYAGFTAYDFHLKQGDDGFNS